MNFLDIVPENIRAIQPYTPGKPIEEVERELGIPAVKLASNENPLGPSPRAVQAVREYLNRIERYPEDTAFYVRRRLADRFRVSMDEIILGSGSSDILAMATHALLTKDSEVLTSAGSFVLYYLLPQIKGVPVIRVPLKNYTFDLAAMGERLSSKTRLVLISNPNNPTGTMVDAGEVTRFMKKVPEHTVVVLDEAYYEYVSNPGYSKSLEYLAQGMPVLILRTFSKAYGLAGLRIGYGLARKDIIEVLNKVRSTFNTSSVAQVAALAALEDQAHVERTVAANRIELQFLYSELSARSVTYVQSAANFVLVDLQLPCQEAFQKMMKQGVIVRPMDGSGFPTMVRVTVGTHDENVKFLKALDGLR